MLKSVTALLDDNSKLKKQIDLLLKEKVTDLKNKLENDFENRNNINFLSKIVDLSMNSAKDLAQALGTSKPNAFVLIGSNDDGMPNIHCYISKELVASDGLNANVIIKELGKYIDGNGGGQPFFASGKGKKSAGLLEAIEQVKQYVL